ncbi:MAG TPA: flagellar basal body L-ring protein FlgH [Allosphingosinicella sp.]|nr:flagellar basal body L-ring protein FlgH [Allosphingosinicella sp.]
MKRITLIAGAALLAALAGTAAAEDLYRGSGWASMSADRKASQPGDILTVVIFQAAEATNSAQNSSRKKTDVGGKFGTTIGSGTIDESASLEFGGGYTGRGEVRRSERLVTQISLTVQEVLPNGDLIVQGEQWMRINGETSRIGVRGRVRPADINADNAVLSTRIADARISYDGRGFVTRSAKPGIINRIFSFLGLG